MILYLKLQYYIKKHEYIANVLPQTMLNLLFYDKRTKKGTIVKNIAMSYCLNINLDCSDTTVCNYHCQERTGFYFKPCVFS